nr:DUF3817 domain-containing protein [Bacillus subtilis]
MLHTPIGRLRTMGFIEGMSLLILLFIAMPLKYWAELSACGDNCRFGSRRVVHFVFACLGLCNLLCQMVLLKWSAAGFVAAFVPFGNFLYDRGLRKYK